MRITIIRKSILKKGTLNGRIKTELYLEKKHALLQLGRNVKKTKMIYAIRRYAELLRWTHHLSKQTGLWDDKKWIPEQIIHEFVRIWLRFDHWKRPHQITLRTLTRTNGLPRHFITTYRLFIQQSRSSIDAQLVRKTAML